MPTSIDLAALGFGGFDTTNLVKSRTRSRDRRVIA
jgi:hypothetical protein